MGRPTTITSETLIETARQLFLDEGPGVTTARIAQECGVSEATLFKRFGNKEALFLEAMGFPPVDTQVTHLLAPRGEESLEVRLSSIALQILDFYRLVIPRILTLRASGAIDLRDHMRFRQSPPLYLQNEMVRYLMGEQQHSGRSVADPEVSARMLLSTLHNVAFFETMGFSTGFEKGQELEYIQRVLRVMGLTEPGGNERV